MDWQELLQWVGWHGLDLRAILIVKETLTTAYRKLFLRATNSFDTLNWKSQKKYPNRERLMKQQADLMVKLGFKDAGYEYVIVDDCWPAKERGELYIQSSKQKFSYFKNFYFWRKTFQIPRRENYKQILRDFLVASKHWEIMWVKNAFETWKMFTLNKILLFLYKRYMISGWNMASMRILGLKPVKGTRE